MSKTYILPEEYERNGVDLLQSAGQGGSWLRLVGLRSVVHVNTLQGNSERLATSEHDMDGTLSFLWNEASIIDKKRDQASKFFKA